MTASGEDHQDNDERESRGDSFFSSRHSASSSSHVPRCQLCQLCRDGQRVPGMTATPGVLWARIVALWTCGLVDLSRVRRAQRRNPASQPEDISDSAAASAAFSQSTALPGSGRKTTRRVVYDLSPRSNSSGGGSPASCCHALPCLTSLGSFIVLSCLALVWLARLCSSSFALQRTCRFHGW